MRRREIASCAPGLVTRSGKTAVRAVDCAQLAGGRSARTRPLLFGHSPQRSLQRRSSAMDEYSLARWRTTFPFSITFWCCMSVMGLLAAVRGNNSHYATPRVTQFALYALCLPPMATLLARICAQRWAFFSSDERARQLFGRAFLIIYLLRDVTYILDPSTPTISPITFMSLCLVRFTWQLLLPTKVAWATIGRCKLHSRQSTRPLARANEC